MSFPSNDSLRAQLVQNGYVGPINDALVAYLRNLYALTEGQYNDLLFYHLGQLGYIGTLNDRIAQWDGTLWSPATLFSSGEQGLWLDFFDTTTTFQDSGATTPATAVDDPLGKVLDKSGNSNHLSQATTSAKMLLATNAHGKFVARTDGFDDFMNGLVINFTATDEMTVFAGVRKVGTTQAMLCELSVSAAANNGTFNIQAPYTTATTYAFVSRGTAAAVAQTSTSYTSPIENVLTAHGKISTPISSLRVNGTLDGTAATSQGTGNFGNYPLYLGMRAGTSLPFNGDISSLIVVNRACTADEIAAVESYISTNMGI